MLGNTRATVIAGGHTHIRLLRTYRGQMIVNPGSVGLAYEFFPDGGVRVPPWAEIAILSTSGEAIDIAFRRIPYDRDATVRAMVARYMPHAAWWSEGWR
jgi:diadenosine tetraphosphatase ApaH/serine/threonine PP2A family protein phosphatase